MPPAVVMPPKELKVDVVEITPEVLIDVDPPMVPSLRAFPDTFPEVTIFESLVSAIAAKADTSASMIDASAISLLPT